jgi:hydroxymethylpyrimidine pyrophosphatase-like HAD family hydrolase
MKLTPEQQKQLQLFFDKTRFSTHGGIITDLDGTAIHEHAGTFSIPVTVEAGLKKIHDLGRPVVINTLRFPLSVIRTFGKEWYKISNAPVPTVLMNGSLLGYMVESGEGVIGYEEIHAFPLKEKEKEDVINTIQELLQNGLEELLVFYYPRDWTKGEIIWTPKPQKIEFVKKKYLSASQVYSSEIRQLTEYIQSEDICMIFLLIEVPEDKRMSYQHTKKSNFFTHAGVNKLSGAKQISRRLNFSLEDSIGAGDTEMDTFLKGVGMAIHVGRNILPYHGQYSTIHVPGSSELGELLFELAAMQKQVL